MLPEVHKLEFTSLNQQEVERCIQWLIETANDLALSDDAKGLYTCAVLGHLAATLPDKCLQLPIHKATKQACDVLLQCLVTSFRKKLSSSTCDELLKAIAPVLVENSSSPGWLTFAANFLSLFGVKNIVEMDIASPKYEKDTYMQLCKLLLSHDNLDITKASKQDRLYNHQFLTRILKLAPDEGTLFKVFGLKEIGRFFYYQPEKDKFCTDFYKDNFMTTSAADMGEKLQQLIYLPKNLRSQLSVVLYSDLLQFIKFVEKPTDKDVENFIEIQLSLKLNYSQIHTILMLLSTSKTGQYQELLLKLLHNERFRPDQWQDVKQRMKVEICFTWIKTRACANEVNEIKVARVYQAAGEITYCSLVNSNKDLKKKLLQSVREWLFQKVQRPEFIFEELKDLEKFPQHVRGSCIHLIQDVLHSSLHIVNEQKLLSLFSHSR